MIPLLPFALSLSTRKGGEANGCTSLQEGLGFDRLSPNGGKFAPHGQRLAQ